MIIVHVGYVNYRDIYNDVECDVGFENHEYPNNSTYLTQRIPVTPDLVSISSTTASKSP